MKRRLLLFSFLVIIMLFATHSLKADDPQLIISAGKGGFMLTSPDGDFQFKVRGYVQADGRFFFNRSSTTIDTFVLRRVRP
ncbi:MAG TPA: hypothetical protein VLH08_09560, partial [Acidobacteriota bacterium]|nr:hypothetical protein [Acidobacteriota bacterium]